MGVSEGLTTAEIKKKNCEKIFTYIYKSKRTSKQTIAQALSLSMPTVSQNLKILESLHLIERNGFYESTGGRKAQMIRCIPDSRIAIGVSVLEDSVQIGAVDLFGSILKEETYTIHFQNKASYYQQVGNFVCTLTAALPYKKEEILGIGISIQGLVSSDGERIIYGNILQNTNSCRDDFQAYLPYPCRLIHDTEASATAEFWNNDSVQAAICLILNRNFGGALVMNGHIHQGSGIIEHMTLHPDGKPCYCGKHGCAEAYCSANSLRQLSGLPFELFFQQLRAGSKKCRTIWTGYLKELALAIDNMRMLINCQFMISGFLQRYIEPDDLKLLEELVYKQTAFPDIPVTFTQGKHGPSAAMLGAAIYYIDSYIKHIDSVF